MNIGSLVSLKKRGGEAYIRFVHFFSLRWIMLFIALANCTTAIVGVMPPEGQNTVMVSHYVTTVKCQLFHLISNNEIIVLLYELAGQT